MTHELKKYSRMTTLAVTDEDGDRVFISARVVPNHDGEPLYLEIGPNCVNVMGEDLTALRDLILSMPAEAFPEPPPRWTEGDVVLEESESKSWVWVRNADEVWRWSLNPAGVADDAMSGYVDGGGDSTHTFTVLRQQSKEA